MAQQRDYSDRLLIDEYLSKNEIELTDMERRNLEEACLPNFLHLGVVIQEADYITYFGGAKYKVKEKTGIEVKGYVHTCFIAHTQVLFAMRKLLQI